MKRIFIIFIISSITVELSAQNRIYTSKVYSDSLRTKSIIVDDLIEGIKYFEFDINNRLTSTLTKEKEHYFGEEFFYPNRLHVASSVKYQKFIYKDSFLIIDEHSFYVNLINRDTVRESYYNVGVLKWVKTFENSQLKSFYHYNGYQNKEGPYLDYYSNGEVRLGGQFKNNLKVGKWQEFYQNGNVKSCGKYNGLYRMDTVKTNVFIGQDAFTTKAVWLKVGKWRYYNKESKLILVEKYNKYGTLIVKER
jgi:antitoxin component YwqK of YwqJK toxin-antitoxin module